MRKKYEVRWSKESVVRIEETIDYLKFKWTQREIEVFLDTLINFENQVSLFPEMYPESSLLQGYRRAVILKQISVFYSFEDGIIKIHTLFDNRQNPSKLK